MCIALGIWHAKRMRFITLSSVACLVGPYFAVLCHKWHDFRKDVLEQQNVYFDLLYKFCLKYFSFKEELSDILS